MIGHPSRFQRVDRIHKIAGAVSSTGRDPRPATQLMAFMPRRRSLPHPCKSSRLGLLALPRANRVHCWHARHAWLAVRPDAGEVIRGSRGCRKVRWSREGKRKSSDVRVIYYNRLASREIVIAHVSRGCYSAVGISDWLPDARRREVHSRPVRPCTRRALEAPTSLSFPPRRLGNPRSQG